MSDPSRPSVCGPSPNYALTVRTSTSISRSVSRCGLIFHFDSSTDAKEEHLDDIAENAGIGEHGTQNGDLSSSDYSSRNLTCTYAGCPVQTVFTRKSDLKKHMDRHTRPYRCDRPGCDAPHFGDIGGLFRHQREVHKSREGDRGITEHFCPDVSCERHTRGFPRRWNLLEHQRRIHGIIRDDTEERKLPARIRHTRRPSRTGTRPSSRPMSPLSSPSDTQGPFSRSPTAAREHQLHTSVGFILDGGNGRNGFHVNGGSGSTSGHGTGIGSPNSIASTSSSGTARDLQLKIQELENRKSRVDMERSKLEQDIDAFKRTLQVIQTGTSEYEI